MNSTLTTFDGYPRDDIDIPQGTTLHADTVDSSLAEILV